MKIKLNLILIACALSLSSVLVATARDRNTPRVAFATSAVPAGEQVYTGAIIGQTNGLAYTVRSDSSTLTVIGVAQNAAASNETVLARSGIFGLKNNGTVAVANIGSNAYAATNTGYTVSSSGTVAVGKIVTVDSDYVWVRVGL